MFMAFFIFQFVVAHGVCTTGGGCDSDHQACLCWRHLLAGDAHEG